MLPLIVLLTSAASVSYAQSCPAGSLPKDQLIEWTPCPVDQVINDTPYYAPTLECGIIDVPLDYTDASSEILSVPVVRVPANSTNPLNQTIIYNPGGPGESGIQGIIDGAATFQELSGYGYDLVSFDPRGVGLNRPYTCPTLDQLDITVADYGTPIDYPNGLNATYYYNALQGEECATTPYAADGEVISTAFNARDIKAIAEALGQDGLIRYWGISYGTLMGSTLAAMFPDKIDRMVLDANINPTDYYHGLGDEAVDDVDREVTYFFETCAEAGKEHCAYADGTSTGAELEAAFYAWLDNLKNGTYSLYDVDQTPLTYDSVKSIMFQALYGASKFPDLAIQLENWYQSTSHSTGNVKRQDSANITSAFDVKSPNIISAVSCGEWDEIPAGDLNDFKNLLNIYNKRSKFGGDQIIGIVFACATWNVTAKEAFAGKFENIKTKSPILFVNSDMDPVTPLVSAQNSSSGFVGSGVLRHNGAGHGAFSHPSTCVFQKILSYWQTGVLPDLSKVCEPNVQPFLANVGAPINQTADIVPNSTYTSETKRYEHIMDRLPTIVHPSKRELVSFNLPFEALKAAKREQRREVGLARRASSTASATASCTSITAITPSATSSSSGSSSSNAATTKSVGSGMAMIVLSAFALLL